MSSEGKQPHGGLNSLASYAMSDSEEEEDGNMHRLSGNISGSDDETSSHSQVPSRNYSPVIKEEDTEKKKTAGRLIHSSIFNL